MIMAILALARAVVWALELLEERRVIVLSDRSPTAITVRRIISDKVTIKAKPLFPEPRSGRKGFGRRDFIGGFQGWIPGRLGREMRFNVVTLCANIPAIQSDLRIIHLFMRIPLPENPNGC
jgi:hypothetical protein